MPNNPSSRSIVARLPATGLLTIESSDNLKFLQGQFTCDVREVSLQHWRYGALCTNQGRMISNFLLAQLENNCHLLRLHISTLEAVRNTLQKFAPFYKGTLTNVSADYIAVGIAGATSPALVNAAFDVVLTDHSVALTEQAIVLKLDETHYQCLIKKEAFEPCWQLLGTQAEVHNESAWELLTIQAGLGEVREQTIEAWTPHMLNLQAIGAINFKKGCYTGQEIVARTEYRGQNKKAMYRIKGSGPAPAAGTPVEDGEQTAGEIVLASPLLTSAGQWEALAVLNEKHLAQPLSCQKQPIALLELPYPIPKKS